MGDVPSMELESLEVLANLIRHCIGFKLQVSIL